MAKKPAEPTSKNELAEIILCMSYGELLKVAEALADRQQRAQTAADFARLLYDWAEAQ